MYKLFLLKTSFVFVALICVFSSPSFAIKTPKPHIISSASFYKKKPNHGKKEIASLIKRYDISEKSILSVGSGRASEEYWFITLSNNSLTCIDIDEDKFLDTKLASIALPKDSSSDSSEMTYYIGDFLTFHLPDFYDQFDVLYYSGFTPDEMRRRDLMLKAREVPVAERGNNLNWIATEDPLHPIVEKSLDFIKPNGLFILQSYYGGIDLQYNPGYIQNLIKQLNRHGIELLDIYCLEKVPGVNLFIGYKGNKKEASAFYQKIRARPIERFHGRITLDNHAKHIFSYDSQAEATKE